MTTSTGTEFACSMCGRPWSPGTDGKWPIRVTATDPPRALAHCLTCADMGAGYDARWCPAHMRAKPLVVHATAAPAPAASSERLTVSDELRRILTRRRNGHLPEPQVELSD